MVTVKIGSIEKDLEDVEENWINQQVNGLRRDGKSVCVRVRIKTGSLNVVLTTPECSVGGGTRPPNPQEKEIFELWNKRGLNESDFTGGNLVAFIKQLCKMLG